MERQSLTGYCACAVQQSSESPSAAVEDGAGCLGWVLSDAGLTAAIANCTAAEAVCRVVPLGALPCGLVRARLQTQTHAYFMVDPHFTMSSC